MIASNELRIGNLVYGVSDRIESVSCVWPTIIATKFNGVESSNELDEIKPIPLTEEWLVKLGAKGTDIYSFVGDNESYRLFALPIDAHNEMLISINGNLSINQKSLMGVSTDMPIRKIEYIHQLQNIVFDFTGEELIYKP